MFLKYVIKYVMFLSVKINIFYQLLTSDLKNIY